MVEDGDRVQFVTLYTRVLLELSKNPKISQETLARRLDVTMRTAQRHLTELEAEGYIRVDREKKPFQYTIEWTRAVPYVSWMRLIALHPDVTDGLAGLSEVASRAYESALESGVDTHDALRAVFSKQPQKQPVAT